MFPVKSSAVHAATGRHSFGSHHWRWARSSSDRRVSLIIPVPKPVRHMREEGYRVVLVNSNPATIMTDPEFADRTYIEPVTALRQWRRLSCESWPRWHPRSMLKAKLVLLAHARRTDRPEHSHGTMSRTGVLDKHAVWK